MERRNFLQTATAAGVGIAGATGTAAANNETEGREIDISSHHRIEGILHEHWAGDPSGTRVPWFRFMCPYTETKSSYYQNEFNIASEAVDQLVNQLSWVDGALVQFYEVYHDPSTGPGEGDPVYGFHPDLDRLDEVANQASFTDDAVYIWDCGDVHLSEIPDWPDNDENYYVNYAEPAMTSSVFHPVFPGVTGDGHGHDFPHVRVRVPDAVPGRMTHAAMHSMTRIRDGYHWNDPDSAPAGPYYPSVEWELGTPVFSHTSYLGTEIYEGSVGADPTNNSRLQDGDNGTCGDELPSSGWNSGLSHTGELTFCTSDTIGRACDWFYDNT